MTQPADHAACDYCHLPLASAADTYCCSGCRFAAAVSADGGVEGAPRRTLTRLGLGIFFAMNVMVFTMAMWTYDVYGEASLPSPQAKALWELFRYLSMLFAGPVMILLGLPLLEHVLANRRFTATTDSLILLGVAAAYLHSAIAVFTGSRHTYFEVATAVLVGVTLGRWLEAVGRQRASEALRSLTKLLPEHVRVVDPHQARGEGKLVPLNDIVAGQWIRILPGERIAIDGLIRRGQAAVDQQLITGESQAAIKEFGDCVYAGSVNLDGDLLVEVQCAPNAGMLHRIIEAVERAAFAKSRLQGLADRVAAVFVPAVALLALAVFVVQTLTAGFAIGLLSALAILLIACPCALGIATPMALHAAIGAAARRGILFRNGDSLERLARMQAICFDKTGTLTTGEAVVEAFISDEQTPRELVLSVARQLSAASIHSRSKAITNFVATDEQAAEGHAPLLIAGRITNLPGRGLSAEAENANATLLLGSDRMMREAGLVFPDSISAAERVAQEQGLSTVFVAWSGRVRGLFTFAEELRPEVAQVITSLHAAGIQTAVLTGDHAARIVETLAGSQGVTRTRLLPEDKCDFVATLRAQRKIVAMVGDGINDAPALAEADIGIAMGCGADVSRDTADLCLLGNDLAQIPWVWELSRQTLRTIRQNLFWAFAYNVVGIGMALCGFLNPIWAAVAMVGSSLFVTTNSLRLAHLAQVGDQLHVPPTTDDEAQHPATAPLSRTLS